ncbi:MAG: asparagine synthase (glutamine-hydrolyzing) [Candidatus Omnitrophota bacterium]
MCGIAGLVGKQRKDIDCIDRTLSLMNNRGPDFQTAVYIRSGENHVQLLHARLSIIDLDKRSHQPFSIGPCTLIFNGEIYNYKEIRTELESRGIVFLTSSDTEVLLRSYLEYGRSCVEHFEGMWAFAIFDERTGELFLSRDRFGEKPLYYMETGSGFYFGSEPKFIRSLLGEALEVNQEHLIRYIINGYKSLYKVDETFYRNIQRVPQSCNLILNPQGDKQVQRYWEPSCIPVKMSLEEAIEGSRHHLLESMKIRLRSDVPMAFCLSGGVDSASLVSIAAKIFKYDVATFSIIDGDERYNELDNIQATIKDIGCKHTLIELSYDRTFEKLRELIAYHDSPISTITYLVHSYISEAISQNGYKVAFSGTSADELFTGYYDHFNLHLYEMRNHPEFQRYLDDWEKHTGKYVRNPYFKNPRLYFENQSIRDHIYLNRDDFVTYLKRDFLEDFSEAAYCDGLLRNRMLNELFHEATPVVLHEDDLNSMKYSIENRSPYLDSRLFQFAYSIPNEYLIKDGYGKYVLREAVKGILNDQVRLDRRKKGFNASLNSIMDFDNPKDRAYILDNGPIYDLFDRAKIEKLLDQRPLPNSYSKFLFNFINAKLFLEIHKESQSNSMAAEEV